MASHRNFSLLMLFSWVVVQIDTFYVPGSYTTYTISSITYPTTMIRPYQWRYIRVELPEWFSKVTLGIQTDVKINLHGVENIPRSELAVICFRDGSLPLPDDFNTTYGGLIVGPPNNGTYGLPKKRKGLDTQLCYPVREFLLLQLTNEQISPGVWYIGLFNGIGPTRTQGRMIIRSKPFSYMASVSVEGCRKPMMWGKDCKKSVNVLACDQSNTYNITKDSSVALVSCEGRTACSAVNEPKVYSTVVVGMTEQLTVFVRDATFNGDPAIVSGHNTEIQLLAYARHGGVPSEYLHDHRGNITRFPLVINTPKLGNWYISVMPVNLSKGFEMIQDTVKVCYTLQMQMVECPLGKAGPNCTYERYKLETYLNRGSNPFESYYLPISTEIPTDATYFPLAPLLSNSSNAGIGPRWTYFQMDIPPGGAGGNIHIKLTSSSKIDCEIYARYGGLPSLETWDYYYANSTSNSKKSTFYTLYHSSEEYIDFYILYAREGTWSIGLRHLDSESDTSRHDLIASFSLERCPKRCSSHGTCTSAFDASGITTYSYCSCDRTHGGVDCGDAIVSHGGHIWQSVFLVASNAAALLPALWCLKQRAYAEWVLFTSSGIASGLYHACDIGTWCVLSYSVLQFMDFWLSFMAVISTFVYLASIDEGTKRTIHTIVAILTAIIALTDATGMDIYEWVIAELGFCIRTGDHKGVNFGSYPSPYGLRSSSVVLVIVIGTVGLLIGWVVEFSTKNRSNASLRTYFNLQTRGQSIRSTFHDVFKKLLRRFRWGYVVVGIVILVLAGISWIVESSETYWIWHSIWHTTVYTASFLFLRSKPADEIHGSAARAYELTRQDSFS